MPEFFVVAGGLAVLAALAGALARRAGRRRLAWTLWIAALILALPALQVLAVGLAIMAR